MGNPGWMRKFKGTSKKCENCTGNAIYQCRYCIVCRDALMTKIEPLLEKKVIEPRKHNKSGENTNDTKYGID